MSHEVSELGRFSDPALFVLVSLSYGERRRPYRLTAAGASALEDRLRELEGFARAGLGRLATA